MTLSTAAFTKSDDNKELCIEASTLGWPPLYAPEMFSLTSEWSGRTITMMKAGTAHDSEDVTGWMYKPCDNSIDMTIEVFND